MPIIRPEISCFPANLLTERPSDDASRRWLVAHTLARQEKSLARQLVQLKIPFYLPLLSRQLRYRGRQATSFIPLYSGFVFCYVNEIERQVLLATRRVADVWEVADQSGLQRDLLCMASALADGRSPEPCDSEWLSKLARQEKVDATALSQTRPATAAMHAH